MRIQERLGRSKRSQLPAVPCDSWVIGYEELYQGVGEVPIAVFGNWALQVKWSKTLHLYDLILMVLVGSLKCKYSKEKTHPLT